MSTPLVNLKKLTLPLLLLVHNIPVVNAVFVLFQLQRLVLPQLVDVDDVALRDVALEIGEELLHLGVLVYWEFFQRRSVLIRENVSQIDVFRLVLLG